jgi:hypothetical protein
MQVDFERAVRHEYDVLAAQPFLDGVVEQVGKVRQLEGRVDATARRPVRAGVVAVVGRIAPAFGDDQVLQPLGARAGGDFERRVAADRAQRQRVRIIRRECPR